VLSKSLQVTETKIVSHLLEDLEINMLRQTVSLKFGTFCHPCDELAFLNIFKPRLNPSIIAKVAEFPVCVVVVFEEQRVKALFRRCV